MKINPVLYLFFAFLIISCSSDDSEDTQTPAESTNYFPLTVGDTWTYNNTTNNQDGSLTTSEETLSVASTSQEQGVTFYNLESDVSPIEQGFVTGILTNGQLVKAGNQLIYDGEITADFPGIGLEQPINIPIVNTIIFDADASAGEVLTDSEPQSITQSINIQGQPVPLTITYQLTSRQKSFLNIYSTGGTDYQDVLSADITLTIEVSASVAVVNIPLLENQDSVKITNYFANNVGLIYSDTDISYVFEEIPSFPSIPDFSINYTQELTSYNVAEE
jgi:hypothetical protein